ncbi:MAG: sigma-70 family RNA polymerase sigma factor [Solirubrobacteraceae bacterium]
MTPEHIPRIAHDPAALEAFYAEHVEAVQRFVARRVDDPSLAADLTAEIFLAVIDSAATYDPSRGTPVAWLYGVARITVSAERRRAARERSANARISGRRLLESDDYERMQERIDAAAQSRVLLAAIDRLGDGERAVLELVALDDLSVAEAAAVLGIRPVAARVRLHRARRAVREHLSTIAGDEESPVLTQSLEVAS